MSLKKKRRMKFKAQSCDEDKYHLILISDTIWAQVDPDGQSYVIFELIIDHRVDNSITVTKENMYCFVNVCAFPISGSIRVFQITVQSQFGLDKGVKTAMGSPFLLYIPVINVTVHIICWVVAMSNHFIVVHVIDLIVGGDNIEIYLLQTCFRFVNVEL